MSGDEEPGSFVSAMELARQRAVDVRPVQVIPAEAYVMEVVADRKRLFAVWNDFIQLKAAILEDPNCYDDIKGKREINRTGATRLATAFGLSLETTRVDEMDLGSGDRRFFVRVRASKGPRYADGLGSCRMSEITDTDGRPIEPASKREHFALTRAATRATKRAIADIVGGTEAE